MKKLLTLKEFNESRSKNYPFGGDSLFYNGIACPECVLELIDSDPKIELTSYPPQKQVECVECGYYGTRIS